MKHTAFKRILPFLLIVGLALSGCTAQEPIFFTPTVNMTGPPGPAGANGTNGTGNGTSLNYTGNPAQYLDGTGNFTIPTGASTNHTHLATNITGGAVNQTIVSDGVKGNWVTLTVGHISDFVSATANFITTGQFTAHTGNATIHRTITYSNNASQFYDGTGNWSTPSGGNATGDMTKAVYDAANISQQVLGINAAQNVTGKTLNSLTNYIDADATHFRIYNNTGGILVKGTPVYGIQWNAGAGAIEVGKASASSAATMPALGLLEYDLNDNATGEAIGLGALGGMNTTAWSDGNALYVSTVAGTLTATKPTGATQLVQKVGIVVRSHLTLGEIVVSGAGRTNDVPNTISVTGNITSSAGNISAQNIFATVAMYINGQLIEPPVTVHNNLSGIQGTGNYHLSQNEATNMTALSSGGSANQVWTALMGWWTPTRAWIEGIVGYVSADNSTLNQANGIATLNNSNLISSGYLGTGTANSSTVLYGNGTWAEPAGGPGGATFTTLTGVVADNSPLQTQFTAVNQTASNNAGNLTNHVSNTSNPHSTTAQQVGAAPTSGNSSITTVGALSSGSLSAGFTAIGDSLIASAATWNAKVTASFAGVTSALGYTPADNATRAAAGGLATLNSSTLIPAAQLGGGTANSTTFLNGAGNFVSIAAGAVWGAITGEITDQTDIIAYFGRYISMAIGTAKGDLVGFTASNASARIPIGTEGQYLTVVGANNTGVGWTTLPSLGVGNWTVVKLTSNLTTTNNGTTVNVQNITGFSFTPTADGYYEFEATIILGNNASSRGPRVGIIWPTAGVSGAIATIQMTGATINGTYLTTTVNYTAAGTPNWANNGTWIATANVTCIATIKGVLTVSASPVGDFKICYSAPIANPITIGKVNQGSIFKSVRY
jgi:hypothetical protein